MTDRNPSSNGSSNNVSSNHTSSNNASSNNVSTPDTASSNTPGESGASISGSVGGQTLQTSQNGELSSRTSDDPDSRIQDREQYYQFFLQQFLGVVGSSDEATVARIVSLIRSGASQQEILTALSQNTEGNDQAGQGRRSERENGSRRS